MGFEASLPYHGLALEIFLIARLAATRAGRPLSLRVDERARLMLEVSRAARHPDGRIPQFGASDAPFNVVPVDFVVNALVAAAADPATAGETLHLVDPEPITALELMRLLSREYAGKDPGYKLPPRIVQGSLRFKTVRDMFSGAPQESIRYLNHAVRFDTRRADDLPAKAGLRCPRFEEYVGPMVRFFRQHEADPDLIPAGV